MEKIICPHCGSKKVYRLDIYETDYEFFENKENYFDATCLYHCEKCYEDFLVYVKAKFADIKFESCRI